MTLVERTPRWMTVDLRALGAFRIALAFTIFVDLAERARAFALYTNDGPMQATLGVEGPLFTLHRGPTPVVVALFVAQAVLAVCFALGWRTRIVGVALFLLVVSLQQRCILASYLGDDLLRALLFWACLLPVGARFSIDSHRSRAPGALRSFAAGGLLLVPVLLFLSTAAEKLVSPAWRDGRALGLFLNTWIYPTPIGSALFDRAPALCPPLTIAALVAEVSLPLLLLTPWWRARVAGAVGLFGLMLGIALMLDVSLFPLVTATALVPFVPSQAWSGARAAAPHEEVAAKSRAFSIISLAAGLTMIVTCTVNFAGAVIPPPLAIPLQLLGLNQRWPMFTNPESVPRGWFVVAGRLGDGRQWDLLDDVPLDATRAPRNMSNADLRFRERRVMQQAYLGADGFRAPTADWLCRRAAQPLASVSVGYAEVRGEPPAVLVIEIVKDQACPPAGGAQQ